MAEENTEKETGALDLSALGSFDFTPAWAKGRPDDTAKYARFEESREEATGRGRPFRPGGGFRRDDRGPRPPAGGPRRDDRSVRRGPPRRDDRPPRAFAKPLDVEVRILPGQKQLGEFIRKIQGAPCMAYPLKQLAYFFLEHLEACVLRLSPKKGAEPVVFHQCKACGAVAFSEEELMAHVVAAHLGDYYESEDVACEAPKGAFACVARCGLSGELLGPPNLHGYDARVREMARTRYPNMGEEAYRARIEMVRDPEVVEAWRQTATKKTVYRKKVAKPSAAPAEGADAEAPAAPAVDREVAELEFRRTIAPSLLSSPKSVDMPADAALASSNPGLVAACRDVLSRERRFPASLFFALRGAFHHRKLQFFRANDPRGPEFVTAVKPTVLDTAHAIPELVALVRYVEEHPDLAPGAVVAALSGGDHEKAQAVKAHIMWLLEKGHLVCYANGGLVPPADHPRWRPQPRRPQAAPEPPAADAQKPADVAPAASAETPAASAETPAASDEAPAASAEAPAPDAEA